MVPVRIDWECKDPNCQPGVQVQLVHKGKGTGKADKDHTVTLMGYYTVTRGKGDPAHVRQVYDGESDSCYEQSIHDRAV